MSRFSKKQLIVAGLAAGIVATGAGLAYAYWTSTGTGNGSATTGSASQYTVTVENVNLANLSPGGPTDIVHFTVHNNSTGHQAYTTATPTVTGTNNAGCTAADFAISNVVSGGTNLAPNGQPGDTATGSFALQMIDTGLNQNACQGVTVGLQVVVG
jgi:hypothetical protein